MNIYKNIITQLFSVGMHELLGPIANSKESLTTDQLRGFKLKSLNDVFQCLLGLLLQWLLLITFLE